MYWHYTLQKSATVLRELLESAPIIDYITGSTRGVQTTKSKHGAAQSPLTWSSLFRNVVGYILKEGDAVAKMEEKSRSSSTITTRKKVSWRVSCRQNQEGYFHL